MNCKTFSLSEVVEKVIDNRGLTPKKLGGDWSDVGYRVISAKNIKNRSLVQEDKIRTIDDSLYSRWMDDDIHRGDIILTSEAPCGETLFWDSDEKIVLGQRLFGIRVKKGYDPYYLFLYLNTRGFQNELSSRMTGTTVQGIRQSELMKCRLYLPSYDVQVAVTKQIKPIDDLIRLNDRINDYLAQLGEITFNRWISEITPLKIGSLTDIADFQNGLAMQKYPPSNNGSYPVLKIRELNMGHCDSESNLCSTNIKPEVVVDNEDIVFSWSGSLVLKIWFGGRCGLNQHLFKVTSDNYPKWFYYFWIKYHLNDFIDIAQNKATTMGHINRNHLEEAKVIIPSDSDLSIISETLDPMFRLYCSISRQAVILEELRNVLLNESLIQNK